MGAAVRVEAHAIRDPRMIAFGRRVAGIRGKVSRRTLGRIGLAAMVEVWSYATERGGAPISMEEIDDVLDVDGAGSSVVECELGDLFEHGSDRVLLRGHDKLGWLEERRESKRRGGKSRARSAKRSKTGKFAPAEHQQAAPAEHQQAEPAHSSAPVIAPVPAPVSSNSDRHSDDGGAAQQAVIELWSELYVEAYKQPPTWGLPQMGAADRLSRFDGGPAEVRRRAERLLGGLHWSTGPHGIEALVRFWDELVTDAKPKRRGHRAPDASADYSETGGMRTL